MAEVTYDLPDRKDPPSKAVSRALIPHFNLFQPPEPDELPPPNFDHDNASIPSDAPPPESPETETLDTATTIDEPYSWKKNISAKDHCLLLLKSLYGLVQAACQWYKKIADIFAKLDFSADP
jgi:hypothetical protein